MVLLEIRLRTSVIVNMLWDMDVPNRRFGEKILKAIASTARRLRVFAIIIVGDDLVHGWDVQFD
jgi:hypothetical protein